jgi:hypothetical protein
VKPGRDLDALVEERVMGRTLRGPRRADTLSFPLKAGAVFHDLPAEEPPPYSTSIEAAWELVEHLGEHRGFWFRLEKQASLPGLWFAAFREAGLDDEDTAVSVTAPHAICLAALKAVGAM